MKAIIYTSKYPYNVFKINKYLKYRIEKIDNRKFITFIGEFNSVSIPVETLDHFFIVNDYIITEE